MVAIRDKLQRLLNFLFLQASALIDPEGDFLVSSRFRDQFYVDFKGKSKNTYVGIMAITVQKVLTEKYFTDSEKETVRKVMHSELKKLDDKAAAAPKYIDFLDGGSAACMGTCVGCSQEEPVNISGYCYNCHFLQKGRGPEPIKQDA